MIYWKEWRLILHFPLPLAVLALVTFGAVVSPSFHLDRLLISFLLVFFGLVLVAYPIDAIYSDWSKFILYIKFKYIIIMIFIGVGGFLITAIYAILNTTLLGIIVAALLMFAIVTYNSEKPKWAHNRYGFAVAWGAGPMAASYAYQTLTLNWIMIPLAVTGFLIAMQEWFTTNTKSPIQQAITKLKTYNKLPVDDMMPMTREKERVIIRKETFRVTNLMCYSLFSLAMTLMLWRLV